MVSTKSAIRDDGFELAGRVVEQARCNPAGAETAEAFDELLNFLCDVADRDILREVNAYLYVELFDIQVPLPPRWSQLIATYGEEAVRELAEEGVIEMKLKIFRAVEANPTDVYATLRAAGLVG